MELGGKAADAFVRRFATAADYDHADLRSHAGTRQRSLAGRALARAVLGDRPRTIASDWRIEADSNGKPYTITPDGHIGPPISISHSRHLVAACVGLNGQIGIDIEVHAARRPVLAIARSAFGPHEIADVEQDRRNFYRIWTLREAMAKATGVGLARVADRTDRVALVRGVGAWTVRDPDGGAWRLAYLTPAQDVSLAVALYGPVAAAEGDWSMDRLAMMRFPAKVSTTGP